MIEKFKPTIRILPDEPGFYYCGLFREGYSSIARVGSKPLAWVLEFYFRVLRAS